MQPRRLAQVKTFGLVKKSLKCTSGKVVELRYNYLFSFPYLSDVTKGSYYNKSNIQFNFLD